MAKVFKTFLKIHTIFIKQKALQKSKLKDIK